ncbi:hypothetical protein PCH_Pc21g00730 [Penicillium rubens Wisconsin 54-1255]|uniref:Uncharacterized protein n=1 Tax=Penicillium rubens (strain ATCC 28089 / DSM 1075 / NRRL 1951 / Wisconsin 54-1255) TaxID=500485 RepID=B6HHF6_PENRW|nr:hypothetical protein PCH_Pc21g00730 [Penicillium rubens Wisconsin 54-1255]
MIFTTCSKPPVLSLTGTALNYHGQDELVCVLFLLPLLEPAICSNSPMAHTERSGLGTRMLTRARLCWTVRPGTGLGFFALCPSGLVVPPGDSCMGSPSPVLGLDKGYFGWTDSELMHKPPGIGIVSSQSSGLKLPKLPKLRAAEMQNPHPFVGSLGSERPRTEENADRLMMQKKSQIMNARALKRGSGMGYCIERWHHGHGEDCPSPCGVMMVFPPPSKETSMVVFTRLMEDSSPG